MPGSTNTPCGATGVFPATAAIGYEAWLKWSSMLSPSNYPEQVAVEMPAWETVISEGVRSMWVKIRQLDLNDWAKMNYPVK